MARSSRSGLFDIAPRGVRHRVCFSDGELPLLQVQRTIYMIPVEDPNLEIPVPLANIFAVCKTSKCSSNCLPLRAWAGTWSCNLGIRRGHNQEPRECRLLQGNTAYQKLGNESPGNMCSSQVTDIS